MKKLKKLSLNKEVVTKLQNDEMKKLGGGHVTWLTISTIGFTNTMVSCDGCSMDVNKCTYAYS